MKTIGQILIWVSLALGVVAATTGYVVSLDLPDDQLIGLTLAEREAEADRETEVTAERLAAWREQGVRNVRVKEFLFWPWRGRWWFKLSLSGLLLGAALTRWHAKADKAAKADADQHATPEAALAAIQAVLKQLLADLPDLEKRGTALSTIVERLDDLQKTEMPAFVEGRSAMISSLGMAGLAAVMNSYAAAERQINRTWSAAADGAYEEAVVCLHEADVLIDQTQKKMQ